MKEITNIIINAILTAAITEIVSLVSLAIKKYIIDKKLDFKFTFLKKKISSGQKDSGVYHPNTPFTFRENHKFMNHL